MTWKATADWSIGDPMKKTFLDSVHGNTLYLNQRPFPVILLNWGTDLTTTANFSSETYAAIPTLQSHLYLDAAQFIGANKFFWQISYNTIYQDVGKKGYVRLYNFTDGQAVTGSEVELPVTASGTVVFVRLPASSANYFSLPENEKLYYVQAKCLVGGGSQTLRISKIGLYCYPE